MASKQQQLREMMKKAQQGKSSDAAGMNAIEKARLMKMLRKKQKEEQEVEPEPPQPAEPTFAVPALPRSRAEDRPKKVISTDLLTSKPPAPTPAAPAPVIPAGLPAGFFDNPPAPSLLGSTYDDEDDEDNEAEEPDMPPTISPAFNPRIPSAFEEEEAETSATIPNLPKGFFDNPYEEAEAQHVDLAKQRRDQQQKDSETLQDFLKNIDEIEAEAVEETEPEEELDENLRLELEQMAYKGRLAKLMLESDQVLHKRKMQEHSSVAGITSESIESMLEEVEEVAQISRTQEQAADVSSLIQQGLKKKAKHSATHAADNGALSFDLYDWRARTL